jgi:hypothetical protein
MIEENQLKTLEAMRTHTWSYFQLHAQQRLTVFHFYVLLCAALTTGLVTSLPKADQQTALPIALASLLIFFSFVFHRLDLRNRDLIKNAELGLRHIESEWAAGTKQAVALMPAAVFSRDESRVQSAKKRNAFVSVFSSHLSFSDCFRYTFTSFALLGVGSIIYAVVK